MLEGNTWKEQLFLIHNSVVFIDEGNRFVSSVEFAEEVEKSDNYFVIITRENLHTLPYSVTEIYGIHSSGKYNSLEPVYHSLYRIYGDDKRIYDDIEIVIIEDSNAGYDFFNHVARNEIKCISANGKGMQSDSRKHA